MKNKTDKSVLENVTKKNERPRTYEGKLHCPCTDAGMCPLDEEYA